MQKSKEALQKKYAKYMRGYGRSMAGKALDQQLLRMNVSVCVVQQPNWIFAVITFSGDQRLHN